MPVPVTVAIDAWLEVRDRLAPGVVEGLYLVGSAALDDWQRASDIDIVAFVADPTDAETVAQLEAAHASDRSDDRQPTVDGPFLAWADVSTPPLAAQRPWTLDGEFRFDGDCFEINPVTWYTLAEYGVAVRGAPAEELGVYLDANDRRTWVRENVDTYWRSVAEQIEGALEEEPDRTDFAAETQEWCALGIARMAYTFETGGVASKSSAGRWAAECLPKHRGVLLDALALRRSSGLAAVDRSSVVAVVALLADLVDAITR